MSSPSRTRHTHPGPMTSVVVLVASLFALVAGAARAGDAVVAKITKVESGAGTKSAKVTIAVKAGNLFNGDRVDVFTATNEKTTGVLKTSPGVDMLLPGDQVVVTLTLDKALPAGAVLIAPTGAYASYAAANAAAGGSGAAASASVTPTTKASSRPATTTKPGAVSPAACLLKPADVAAVFGGTFTVSNVRKLDFEGGQLVFCTFTNKDFVSVSVEVDTWKSKRDYDQQFQQYMDITFGKITPIAGDADKAGWGDLSKTLHYTRGLSHLALNVSDSDRTLEPRLLRARLLKLRRVP